MARQHEKLSIYFAAILALLEDVLTPAEQWQFQISIDAGEHRTTFRALCSNLREKGGVIPTEAAQLLVELGKRLRVDESVWGHFKMTARDP